MIDSYLKTALWSSTGDDDQPLDANYDIDDFSPEARRQSNQDCFDFLELAKGLLDGHSDSQIGHDFWLTRNRHGAGFWEGDYPEHGDALTEIAHSFGEVNLYIGDDGKVHL